MKLKIFVTALIVVSVGTIFLLKSNDNGGIVMAQSQEQEQKTTGSSKVLVAYFSKAGEQYSVGTIKKGNTEIMAEMIAAKTGADTFEIKVAKDKYPKAYKDLIDYAQKEKRNDERPEIAGKVNVADYDVIFVGYPNWWGDMPMPVYTFLESYDFSNKTIIPFGTHEGSGLASSESRIKSVSKAKEVKRGLGIYGHTAQNSPKEANKKVSDWLKQLGF